MPGDKLGVLLQVILFFLMIGQFGCSGSLRLTDEPASGAFSSLSEPVSELRSVRGKVVETLDAGHFTYVRLERGGKKDWVAIPRRSIEAGTEMTLQPGLVMHNFYSKPLHRAFRTIVFSDGPVVAQAQPVADR